MRKSILLFTVICFLSQAVFAERKTHNDPETENTEILSEQSEDNEEVAEEDATTVGTDSSELIQAENSVSELEELRRQRDFFRGYYIKEVMKNIDNDRGYLSTPYSKLDTLRLSEIAERYMPCLDDATFAEMIKRINVLKDNVSVYKKAEFILSADGPGYTKETPGVIDGMIALIKQPVSKEQELELNELRNIVEIYPKAVQVFKIRIEDIRKQLDREESSKSKDYALSIQSDILPHYMEINANGFKNEYNYRISKVPGLKALYERWLEKIKKNFLDPEVIEIENSVMSINLETE